MLTRAQKAEALAILASSYPNAKPALDFTSPFELLVATILSAQCTDVMVNQCTKELFPVANTPAQMAAMTEEELFPYIKRCGFYRMKGQHILETSRILMAKFGGEVHCLIGDALVAEEAKKLGITRSMVAMRTFGAKLNGSVVAIGNAPTALFEVLRLMREEGVRPACIIGIPVGFVGAAESKEALIEQSPVPYITVRGTKGGSPIAASVVNAIQYLKGR